MVAFQSHTPCFPAGGATSTLMEQDSGWQTNHNQHDQKVWIGKKTQASILKNKMFQLPFLVYFPDPNTSREPLTSPLGCDGTHTVLPFLGKFSWHPWNLRQHRDSVQKLETTSVDFSNLFVDQPEISPFAFCLWNPVSQQSHSIDETCWTSVYFLGCDALPPSLF